MFVCQYERYDMLPRYSQTRNPTFVMSGQHDIAMSNPYTFTTEWAFQNVSAAHVPEFNLQRA